MFIVCSKCDFKYLINSADLKPNGRMVECANCHHQWFQDPDKNETFSSAPSNDLKGIEGFDEEMAELLINRAKEALLTLAMEITTEDLESNDLMSVEGMDMVLALELSQKGISDREELAEQSIEELMSLIDISEEDAGDLIMKARAHWFE